MNSKNDTKRKNAKVCIFQKTIFAKGFLVDTETKMRYN
jgi:hypothetical protein